LKSRGELPSQQKSRAEGFMMAGKRIGLIDKTEVESIMEQVHMQVFAMSIRERRLMQVKGEQFDVDWSYYDKPIMER
jgi:hypothetical protein